MTAPKSEALAQELDAVGLQPLGMMARLDHFHDQLTVHKSPSAMLVSLLDHTAICLEQNNPEASHAIRLLHSRVVDGEFRDSLEEVARMRGTSSVPKVKTFSSLDLALPATPDE